MKTTTNSFKANPERVYRSPPVVEALCEVYFASTKWNDSIFARFYDEIKGLFPLQEERESRQADIVIGPNEFKTDVQLGPIRKLYFTENRDQLVQVAENLLVFNQLSPYRPFLQWKEHFFYALSKFMSLANPDTIEKIGVRYLNHIDIPREEFPLSEYFTISPTLPQGINSSVSTFLVNCVVPQVSNNHSLTITFNTIEQNPPVRGHQLFLLDLYEQAVIKKHCEMDEVKDQLSLAHSILAQAFEGSITDKLRNQFNEGNPE